MKNEAFDWSLGLLYGIPLRLGYYNMKIYLYQYMIHDLIETVGIISSIVIENNGYVLV